MTHGRRHHGPASHLNLLKPARIFLLGTSTAECLLVGPNVAAELVLAEDGPHVAICRICLFVARISLILVPLLAKLSRRLDPAVRSRLDAGVQAVCGTACGSVEPSRGIATALAGWYLISTPMHDAFASPSPQEQNIDKVSEGLVMPCVLLMTMNVCLFLCDALMLTVAPLLRQAEAQNRQPVHPISTAEVFKYGRPRENARNEKEFNPTCVICLADFEADDDVARLPCGHVFHTECVSEWLKGHGTCPLRCPGYVLPPGREEFSVSNAQAHWRRRLPLRTIVHTSSVEGRFVVLGADVDEDLAFLDDESSADSLSTERLTQEASAEEYAQVFASLPSVVPDSLDAAQENFAENSTELQIAANPDRSDSLPELPTERPVDTRLSVEQRHFPEFPVDTRHWQQEQLEQLALWLDQDRYPSVTHPSTVQDHDASDSTPFFRSHHSQPSDASTSAAPTEA